MSTERWIDFWLAQGRAATGRDPQTQVLRTFNKQPISPERWQDTLSYIDGLFPVGPADDVLDLCCGNGLFTMRFAARARTVIAVDISPDLLSELTRRSISNVETLCKDARQAEFKEGAFSRIWLYAGIQYFSEAEVILLFASMWRWLRPDGLLFIGDIPDRSRLWSFYNTPERRSEYFDNCVNDRDVVGSWFDSSWLRYLADNTGFRGADVIPQPSAQIYAHFRFDMKVLR